MARNAPGKRFRKGMSLIEIARMFPDDAAAERRFARTRWPDGPRCPSCGSANVQDRATRKPQPYRCRDCRRDFSVRTGTLMQGSKPGFQVRAIAICLLATNLKGVSSLKLHRDLGVTQKTAWYLAQRIRETWNDDMAPFSGSVEADETCIGGKRRNMPWSRRRQLTGRGTAAKTAVVGAGAAGSGRGCATADCLAVTGTAPAGAGVHARRAVDGIDGAVVATALLTARTRQLLPPTAERPGPRPREGRRGGRARS